MAVNTILHNFLQKAIKKLVRYVVQSLSPQNTVGNIVILLDNDSAASFSVSTHLLLLIIFTPHTHNSDIKPHFSNPQIERIWSKSIVSSLKMGMKGKAASEMREEGREALGGGKRRGEEEGRGRKGRGEERREEE